jgi:perosamine synthetase
LNDAKEQLMPGLQVPLAQPWFGDEEPDAARAVVESGWLIFGPKVAEFEQTFAEAHGARHGIAVNSGSSALLIGMAALGVQAGSEVISPDMTFVSTASAALFLGARPVFADIDPIHHHLDPADLERRITADTSLIVPVHYAGHAADMPAILEIAGRHGIPVLEDAAEAHLSMVGSRYVGTLGAAGIFSFTPSKPMTTGEGGMILTNDDEIAEKCRLLRNFGDLGKFEWEVLGFNFRMPEVMGAIGLQQLAKLPQAIRIRHEIAARYTKELAGVPGVSPPQHETESATNYQLYTLRLDREEIGMSRDEVIAAMQARGVSTRLYYPALHNQGVFAPYGPFDDADYPATMAFAESALSLPIFPGMTDAQQDLVVQSLIDVVGAE